MAQIAPRRKYAPALDRVLRTLLTDERTIRYRQGILSDILDSPELRKCCEKLAGEAEAASRTFRMASDDRPHLYRVTARVAELEDFTHTVDTLHHALRSAVCLKSEGLRVLRERVETLATSRRYEALRNTIAGLAADMRSIRSVTVGLNLDLSLRPVEATLLSINRFRFRGSRFADMVLGSADDSTRRGIADLHSMVAGKPGHAMPVAGALFRDLAAILDQVSRSMERDLTPFSQTTTRFATSLKQELVAYASAVSLVDRLRRAGLPTCAPVIAPREQRVTDLRDSYNVNLAFRMLEHATDVQRELVRNDAVLSDPFRVAVLTGPNSGGKSVFLQGLGLAQLLAQTGMHVPAASATVSVADSILTHFQTLERPDKETGRLHEEASRLRELFDAISRFSLVLPSETFSSTGSSEAAYLLGDVLRALQRLGARAAFSTHLHELADAVQRDPSYKSGETQVTNLVALSRSDEDPQAPAQPTYRIARSEPRGRSYAEMVARQLGIQYDQLISLFEQSGRLPHGEGGR